MCMLPLVTLLSDHFPCFGEQRAWWNNIFGVCECRVDELGAGGTNLWPVLLPHLVLGKGHI